MYAKSERKSGAIPDAFLFLDRMQVIPLSSASHDDQGPVLQADVKGWLCAVWSLGDETKDAVSSKRDACNWKVLLEFWL
jgi:hypothetical protein